MIPYERVRDIQKSTLVMNTKIQYNLYYLPKVRLIILFITKTPSLLILHFSLVYNWLNKCVE
jgi:hypothetical protein